MSHRLGYVIVCLKETEGAKGMGKTGTGVEEGDLQSRLVSKQLSRNAQSGHSSAANTYRDHLHRSHAKDSHARF